MTCNAIGQVIRTDTNIFSDSSKMIIQYEPKRTISTVIVGKDTSVQIDNSLFYNVFMDSLKGTYEYLHRDTLSNNIDFIFIHIAHAIGCYGVNYIHKFLYYNPSLITYQKGVFLSTNFSSRERFFGYIDSTKIDSIISILNDNMAFNITGSGYEVLPESRNYGTGRNDYKINICAKINNRILKNEFKVYPSYFGFGNIILGEIQQIGFKYQINYNETKDNIFFIENDSTFNESEYLQEMIHVFLKNDITYIKY